MNHIAGRFKGLVMLTMLMLIATRLTWLQTSENKLEISATFYRTGLWFNQYARSRCSVSPESTFPLPAEMTVRSDILPPPPTQGQLSPGLAMIMTARCQFARLDVDDFSHWNPWVFMTTALFAGLFTRIMASSWTAGLITAVTVLSRGTVQGRANLAAAEPFAMALTSGAFFFGALFVRSLWSGWLATAIILWCASLFFVPSLWISAALWMGLFVIAVFRARRFRGVRPGNYRPLASIAVQSFGEARSPNFWMFVVMVSFVCFALSLTLIHGMMPSALDDMRVLFRSVTNGKLFQDLPMIWSVTLDQIRIYSHDIDLHVLAALVFLSAHPSSDGAFGSMGRVAAFGSFLVIIGQLAISLWVESLGASTMSGLAASVVPSARALELPLIAWGTASFWRILDGITGHRLSSSGWSIRGHATINR